METQLAGLRNLQNDWEEVLGGDGAATYEVGGRRATYAASASSPNRAYARKQLAAFAGQKVTLRVLAKRVSGTPTLSIDYPSIGSLQTQAEITGSYWKEYEISFTVPPEADASTESVYLVLGTTLSASGEAVFTNPSVYYGADANTAGGSATPTDDTQVTVESNPVMYYSTDPARETLLVRYDSQLSEGAGINLYGDADPNFPNAAMLLTGTDKSIQLNADGSVFLDEVTGTPSTPTGGGLLYISGGDLLYKSPTGTVTNLVSGGSDPGGSTDLYAATGNVINTAAQSSQIRGIAHVGGGLIQAIASDLSNPRVYRYSTTTYAYDNQSYPITQFPEGLVDILYDPNGGVRWISGSATFGSTSLRQYSNSFVATGVTRNISATALAVRGNSRIAITNSGAFTRYSDDFQTVATSANLGVSDIVGASTEIGGTEPHFVTGSGVVHKCDSDGLNVVQLFDSGITDAEGMTLANGNIYICNRTSIVEFAAV